MGCAGMASRPRSHRNRRMTLSIEEVEHIATLARLSLSPAEKELFEKLRGLRK